MTFETTRLPSMPTAKAPDGSDVRVLLQLARGSMAHFELAPGQTSTAVAHRTIEEIWYVLDGLGEIWRRSDTEGREAVTELDSGVCVTLPAGTAFQFRCLGPRPLGIVAVTMPPWPGPDEAYEVKGHWPANVR